MLSLLAPSTRSFIYRKTKPFTKAEFRFKTALAEYATNHLLKTLQSRNSISARPRLNRYTGISARISLEAIYLEAVLVNDVEWGGFSFEFSRLVPANNGLYNLS